MINFVYFLGFLQFVFKASVCKERTIHEELAKNVTGLLKSNDSTTVKHVLKVNSLKTPDQLLVGGVGLPSDLEGDGTHRFSLVISLLVPDRRFIMKL